MACSLSWAMACVMFIDVLISLLWCRLLGLPEIYALKLSTCLKYLVDKLTFHFVKSLDLLSLNLTKLKWTRALI